MRRAGFTILEILIAIVVLVLGITGILALFPTAIDSGNKTVEDSYAAAITQSVVDAVAVGLRESRYTWPAPSTGDLWTYFIFDHDGVVDTAPLSPEKLDNGTDSMWTQDYCIILPRCKVTPEPAGGNTNKDNEPVFLYPIPSGPNSAVPVTPPGAVADGGDPEQRSPTGALDSPGSLVDNFHLDYFKNTTTEDTPALWVSRVYHLGRYRLVNDPPLPPGMNAGDIRLEYRGQDLVDPTVTVTDPNMIALDPYPSYSFAFAIKRARVDTTGTGGVPDGMVSPGPTLLQPSNPVPDAFSNSLYELRIMIFKNFSPDEATRLAPTSPPTTGGGVVVPKTNVPIKQFITLISI